MRRDARRVDVSALMQCCIDLKPTRKENEVYINQKIDVTKLVQFIEESKKQGSHYTYFHAFFDRHRQGHVQPSQAQPLHFQPSYV